MPLVPSIEIGKRNESDPGIVAVLEIGNRLSGRMSVEDSNKVLAFGRDFIMNFFPLSLSLFVSFAPIERVV